ncbi:MAG TPA: hypothetical protein VFV56_03330 [Gaiellaceae bacterium]|nr:hypothetical protein [Gaiellaceae bacterium]
MSEPTRRHRSAGLPLAVWAVAAVTVALAAAAFGYAPWDSATWSRWDSGLYEDIARDGYDLFRCEEEPEKWCGDAGWFPAFPWLIGALHLTGLPLQGTAAIVAWLLAGGTVLVLWATFLERRGDAAAVAALVYAAFAPGQIYHYAIFPLSLYAISAVACLWFVHRGRYVLGGLTGGVAALAYPAGLLLAPVVGVWLLVQSAVPFGERLRRVAISSGLIVGAVWLLLLDQWLETGRWDAYLLVQDKYEHGWQNPLEATWDIFTGGVHEAVDLAVALQTGLVLLVLVLVLVRSIRARVGLASADALVLLWAIATWALPISTAGVSIPRGQATLLPLAILVARLPAMLAWPIALAAAALAVWMERYFLNSTLF